MPRQAVELTVVELRDESSVCLKKMAEITGRTPGETECDLHHTYLWVLREQAKGRRIISVDEQTPQGHEELVNLVKNPEIAHRYFVELGWE